jgi:hypothetical protein
MQDSDWGEAPKKERRIPTWAWWTCGGGCLAVLLVGLLLVFFVVGRVREATDPEKVWAEVAEVLPHDERPAGWETMLGGSVLGVGQYHLLPAEPSGCHFMIQIFPSASMLDPNFDPDAPQNQGAFGVGRLREAEQGTFVLQGREVRSLSFLGGTGSGSGGAGLRLDLSGGEAGPHVFVQILTPTRGEKLSNEEIEHLFAPFDVWRGR